MKTKPISLYVRFSKEDAELIDRIAKKRGMWKGAWMREVIIKELVRLGHIKSNRAQQVREYGRCLKK